MDAQPNGLLKGYRILDLCDEKGLMAGKLLGDLGAEVIKVEPPHGDTSRRIGPFCNNEKDPEKSKQDRKICFPGLRTNRLFLEK